MLLPRPRGHEAELAVISAAAPRFSSLGLHSSIEGMTEMQRRDINAETAPQPVAAYSQAVEVTGGTRMLFISGQLGIGTDGTAPAGMAEQARLAWRNLEAQLKAAGMGLDNLVKVTTIIPNPADIPASRPARAEALGDRRPASTVIVAGLANPDWKIEIEAIAYA